jgi:glycosyltransferase involved in cell wall biosynthesis
MAPRGELYQWMKESGVDVESLAGRLGIFGVVLRLVRTLRHRRVDAIEAYGFRAVTLTRIVGLAVGRPAIIVGVRGLHLSEAEDAHGWKTRLGIAIERALAWTVTCYDANSEGARDFLVSRGLPSEKFVVIPNGVDLDSFSQTRTNSEAIVKAVCVARFIPRKRHDLLLHALARIRESGVDMQCELIGYGPMRRQIEAVTRELGLDDRVIVVGSVSPEEVCLRLAGADVFVLTSQWEGMPGSVLEAMAAGLPVVASKVNGTSEVIQDGVTGFLVPQDDADATAEALIRLARDPELRQRMGAAGRERITQHFSVARMVSEKEELYTRLAARHIRSTRRKAAQ